MTIYVTDAFKRHVPDWEHHVHGTERVWSEYGEGWLDGYDCAERDFGGAVVLTSEEAQTLRYMLCMDTLYEPWVTHAPKSDALRAKLRRAAGGEGAAG